MFPRPSGIVTLCTDFGLDDVYVGVMKGALLRASGKVQVVDLGHAVPPQDVAAGAFQLWAAIGRFPGGTVHVGVVDPGVGTARAVVAVFAHGDYWIVPDNGLIAAVVAGDPAAEARALDLDHLGVRPASDTFHGRDVMAPVAAMLAAGRYGFRALGPRVELQAGEDPVFGGGARVVHVDRFGNLVSNVTAAQLGGAGRVEVGGREAPVVRTYAEVPPGQLLAYVGAFGLLEVGVNGGSAAAALGLGTGAAIRWLPA
ncbi:MAG: SAM-dependent chlorinase/fluorinase [Planctomycetes bacterium]|nr:SAM-dependent chlorinase/fluorinase [Planctomycetota bacterium]